RRRASLARRVGSSPKLAPRRAVSRVVCAELARDLRLCGRHLRDDVGGGRADQHAAERAASHAEHEPPQPAYPSDRRALPERLLVGLDGLSAVSALDRDRSRAGGGMAWYVPARPRLRARSRRGNAADGGCDQPRLLILAEHARPRAHDRRRNQLWRLLCRRRAHLPAAQALAPGIRRRAGARLLAPRLPRQPHLHRFRSFHQCLPRLRLVSVHTRIHGCRTSPPAAVPSLACGLARHRARAATGPLALHNRHPRYARALSERVFGRTRCPEPNPANFVTWGSRRGGPMIARIWRGAVRTQDGNAYSRYMQDTGVAGYTSTPGNRGVWMLRRDVGEKTEFLMFTLWESLDAIKAFAGEDYESAVFYPEDDRYLIERELTSSHYVLDTHASPGAAAGPTPMRPLRQ